MTLFTQVSNTDLVEHYIKKYELIYCTIEERRDRIDDEGIL